MVSPVPTHPCITGNRAKILSLVHALRALGHEVHFICLDMWDWEAPDRAAMAAEIGEGRLHWLDGSPDYLRPVRHFVRTWAQKFRIPAAHDYGLDEWYDPSLNTRIAAIDAAERFDAVFVEYVFASRAFEAFRPEVLRILDTHDAFGDRYRALRKDGARVLWFSTSLKNEIRGFERADAILAIQEEEAAGFRKRLGGSPTQVFTVSHMLDVAEEASVAHRSGAAAFLGSGNGVNILVFEHFLTRILPHVLTRMPDFRVYLGGSICPKVPDHPNVEKMGIVDHPLSLFEKGPIAINPSRIGTGINIKMLDALALGVPTVSTETGARGLIDGDREGIWVTPDDDPQAFADALIELASNPEAWARRHHAALAAARRWNARQSGELAASLEVRSLRYP